MLKMPFIDSEKQKGQAIGMEAELESQQQKSNDSQLLIEIAAGDKQAMSKFVNRHLDSVIQFSRRYVGQQSDAEDVAQEAFTRVWTKASQWQQGNYPARNWLFRITYNLCIDVIRKRKLFSDDKSLNESTTIITPEEQFSRSESQNRLNAALHALPERQCAAIMLCHYQGFSNKDAAKTMDISVDALESLLSRGRGKLRELLLECDR